MDTLIAQDIKEDLLKGCFSALNTSNDLIKNINDYKILPTDSEKERLCKEGCCDNILIWLGRTGELAFKYMLKLKIMEWEPNINYQAFQSHIKFLNSYLTHLTDKKHVLKEEDKDEIINFGNNTEKGHNYAYQNLLVEKLMGRVNQELKKYYSYKTQSYYILDLIKEEYKSGKIEKYGESNYFETLIFPCEMDDYLDNTTILNKAILKIRDKGKAAGDIFTRLRYFSNNLNDAKNYSIDDIFNIFYYIKTLTEFAEAIYDSGNDLNVQAEIINAKHMAKTFAKEFNRTPEEVEEIFSTHKKDDPYNKLMDKLFYNYSVEEIKEIEEFCQNNNLNSTLIFYNHISAEALYLMHEKGYDKAFNYEILDEIIEKELEETYKETKKYEVKEEEDIEEEEEDYEEEEYEEEENIFDYLEEDDEIAPKHGLDYYDKSTSFYDRAAFYEQDNTFDYDVINPSTVYMAIKQLERDPDIDDENKFKIHYTSKKIKGKKKEEENKKKK